ncbi:hypothetical protein HMPREF1986_01511 [Oribacterium sp. oral taxon 078 str. F0263]|nr:hypothetical protein HMPREF1986_01511 [Oribacterium sp. oral taxon 078 str. F0263]
MKDSSDTRTEIIGGAFFVRKKKSHRSERKKGKMRKSFHGRAIGRVSCACFFGKRDFLCGALWINDKKLSRFLEPFEGGDRFFYGKSQ